MALPQGDQIYGGNMMMWEKFANSLKLRVAVDVRRGSRCGQGAVRRPSWVA